MEPTTNNQTIIQKYNIQKYVIVIACILSLSLLLSLSYFVALLASSKIYPNIKVMGVSIEGLSKEKAVSKLEKYYSTEGRTITIKIGEKNEILAFEQLKPIYDIKQSVDNAYKLGHEGGVIKRAAQIIKLSFIGATIDIPLDYDKHKLKEVMDRLEKDVFVEPIDDSYQIKGDILTFNFGHSGRGIDRVKAIESIDRILKYGQDGTVVFEVTDIPNKKLDTNTIPTEPKDASYTIEDYKTVKYIPEVYGVILDKEQFSNLLAQNLTNRKSFDIPVKTIKPNISVDDIKTMMFIDNLAFHETSYTTSPENRKINVRLAASRVSDIILAPGEEFSYNKIVGPRTAEKGFKMAHVYSNGRIIDDYGGGICQVSSTLYNAVLKAGLRVTERRNHMFTVSYALPGLDATVSYGSIDFRFINNTDWPIKIVNNTNSSKVGFTIVGTNLFAERKYEYVREIVKEIPYNTQTIEDSTLYIGESKVEQNGSAGYVLNVYRLIKENGVVVKKEFIYRDSYQPLDKIQRVGTKPKPNQKNNINSINNTNSQNTVPGTSSTEDKYDSITEEENHQGPSIPVINQEEPITLQ